MTPPPLGYPKDSLSGNPASLRLLCYWILLVLDYLQCLLGLLEDLGPFRLDSTKLGNKRVIIYKQKWSLFYQFIVILQFWKYSAHFNRDAASVNLALETVVKNGCPNQDKWSCYQPRTWWMKTRLIKPWTKPIPWRLNKSSRNIRLDSI